MNISSRRSQKKAQRTVNLSRRRNHVKHSKEHGNPARTTNTLIQKEKSSLKPLKHKKDSSSETTSSSARTSEHSRPSKHGNGTENENRTVSTPKKIVVRTIGEAHNEHVHEQAAAQISTRANNTSSKSNLAEQDSVVVRKQKRRRKQMSETQLSDHELSLESVFVENEESLDDLQLRQRKLLREKTSRPQRGIKLFGNPNSSDLGDRPDDESPLPTEDTDSKYLWYDMIRKKLRLQPDFFKSQEARMQIMDAIQNGIPAYQGLAVNCHNCMDLATIYSDEFLTKELCRKRSARRNNLPSSNIYSDSFKQLMCVAGQFIRWAIVRRKIALYDGWISNSLFDSIADQQLVMTFVEYYQVRASASTVNCKTIQLRTICRAALNRCGCALDRKDVLNLVYLYLSKTGTASKQLDRRNTSLNRRLLVKEAEGKIMLPKDYAEFITQCETSMTDIMNSVKNDTEQNPRHSKTFLFSKTNGLINRWCINFTSYLILLASGQRPQVFHQLQCPSNAELNIWTSEHFSNQFIELETIDEKRGRALDIPNVIIPRRVTKFLKFHVEVAREYIMEKTEVYDEKDDNPLLIDSRNGDYLDTRKITTTIRAFLVDKDPEFRHMTTMSLRASYATMMFRAHRDKEVFPTLSENQFLEELGKIMNTSLEHLRETYILCGTVKFTETATEISKFLEKMAEEERVRNNDTNIIESDEVGYEQERHARSMFF